LPEPSTSDEAKQVLDTALTIVTRRGDYEFAPPLESEPQEEIMAYAISAVGRRGSGGWVAWESGGERIMHPVALTTRISTASPNGSPARGVERPEQMFFEVVDAMNHERGRLRARLREDV